MHICILILCLLFSSLAFAHDEDVQVPLTDEDVMIRSDEPEAPIGGIPYEEARAIFFSYKPTLESIPGVEAVALGDEGFVVYADEFAELPLSLGGLSVTRMPPMGPAVNGRPATEVRQIFDRNRARLERIEQVQGVGLGPEGILVYAGKPELLPASVEGIPVVAREPMGVAVNGKSVMEVEAIFARAQAYFGNVPGVLAVRLGPGGLDEDGKPDGRAGLYVYTTQPNFIPPEFEGVPIYTVVFTPPETVA